MNIEEKEDVSSGKGLIEDGAETLGGAAGAFLGLYASGPEGALAAGAGGVIVTKALIRMFHEVQGRLLSKREKARTETVKDYAITKIEEKLAEGAKRRGDDFFEIPTSYVACEEIPIGERPVAEEIFEGILLAAQREHEEKKIPFLGNLLVNIAFNENVDKEHAYLLIKLAKYISFRQMCLLALFADSSKYALKDGSYKENGKQEIVLGPQRLALLHEIHDLDSKGLLACGTALLCIADVDPGKMKLEGPGKTLYYFMELRKIDSVYLNPIASLLQ